MGAVLRFIWNAIRAFNTIAAAIFFILFFFLIASIGQLSREEAPRPVPDGAAFAFNPTGHIVEQKRAPQFEDIFNEFTQKEILLRDALMTIDHAAKDDRIKMMVLSLERLISVGPAALHSLGNAITAFKETGKPVYAIGDAYTQSQYYLAAHADEVWLNPAGGVTLTGYGSYQPYFASALEKLKANVHVFRVGTYKSAIEPFTRDSMSDEAKEANRAFLNTLWDGYLNDIAMQRGVDSASFEQALSDIVPRFRDAGGDFAQFALQQGWVDALTTRDEMNDRLIEMVGQQHNRYFRHVGFESYLKNINHKKQGSGTSVAVVTLRGTIIPGEAPPDQIGADTALQLIKTAKRDKDVKALVVRVDSGGGSSFASEIIRQALIDVQEAGKPVVVSFGSVAASGGYWISASADEIWAMPETITGSIGVFGLFATFEETLDSIGIHSDGVGTTQLAGAISPTRPLSPVVANIIQESTNHIYDRFLEIVAEGRGMTTEDVDKIAQGRVWAGTTAQELGLVDKLGGLDDAVASAAARAGLEEGKYSTKYIRPHLDSFEQILADLTTQAGLGRIGSALSLDIPQPLRQLGTQVQETLNQVQWMNDPQGVFALCSACEVH